MKSVELVMAKLAILRVASSAFLIHQLVVASKLFLLIHRQTIQATFAISKGLNVGRMKLDLVELLLKLDL